MRWRHPNNADRRPGQPDHKPAMQSLYSAQVMTITVTLEGFPLRMQALLSLSRSAIHQAAAPSRSSSLARSRVSHRDQRHHRHSQAHSMLRTAACPSNALIPPPPLNPPLEMLQKLLSQPLVTESRSGSGPSRLAAKRFEVCPQALEFRSLIQRV